MVDSQLLCLENSALKNSEPIYRGNCVVLLFRWGFSVLLQRFLPGLIHPALQHGTRGLVVVQESHPRAHVHLGINDFSFGLEKVLPDRKSVVKGKSVDLGGRRIIKKKKKKEDKRAYARDYIQTSRSS